MDGRDSGKGCEEWTAYIYPSIIVHNGIYDSIGMTQINE